jgi:hypothetical protein
VLGVVWYVLSDVLSFVLVLWFCVLIRPVRSSEATLGLVVPSGEGSRELAEESRADGSGESCLEWIFRVGWTSPNVQARSGAAMKPRRHRDSGCGAIRSSAEKSKLIPSFDGRYYENTKPNPKFLVVLTTGGQARSIAYNEPAVPSGSRVHASVSRHPFSLGLVSSAALGRAAGKSFIRISALRSGVPIS